MMKRAILLGASLALLVLLLPAPALALGVALGPPTLEITNALRGGDYERAVTVFNPSKAEAMYSLGAEGQAESWLSFYEWSSKKAVQSLPIAGESNTNILVKVNVPSDITNGTYTATIYAETAPDAGFTTDTGVSTVLRATSVLTITVSDNQIVDGTVGNISARDTEAGFPLRLEVNFKNTGNVAVQPKIDCQIDKGNTKVAEFSYAKTTVKPESQETIPVEWATTADQSGDYVAQVTVSLDEKTITTRELPFKILPPGSFTKEGELTSLAYEGQPLLDAMLKIQAGFQNTGQGDARAKLIGEVYCDGNLIDTIESEELLIPVGEQDILKAYLRVDSPGEYLVKGYINYEGKKTEVKEISFTITEQTVTEPGQQYIFFLPAIGVIIIFILIALIYQALRRRRQPS